MKSELVWHDRVPERDGYPSVVYDVAFRPDGTQMILAVGNRVLVYDADDGDLLHSLKGHEDNVYCVAYSRDGKRFASGGADKAIIIWTHKCEGILKYRHNDTIQCLSYNPVTQQLASATASDFGLWSPEQKSVHKFKVSAKVLCSSWTSDGQYLALGQQNGHITVRDKQGNEKVRIERGQPVWCLSWNPSRDEGVDILAVGCWDQTLSFYQLSGAQIGKDRDLKFDPCSLTYFNDGEYIVLGGSNRKVTMWTKEGVFLKTIAETDEWVWAVKQRPKSKSLALGCNDGRVQMYQTVFGTVHGLYQDRYAYRDTMTDVIIQHLITEQKVRIRTRDYVKKIAIYRDRLAVQLPDRVLVYETGHNDEYDMHYRLRERILKKLDCNLLVVTSIDIVLCQEKRLQLYSFRGHKIREWVLEAVIRYIKVVGGPSGREGLLVGLKNGSVEKIFLDNRFPINLIKHGHSIRCLDLSASRRKLAVVDDNNKVFIYDLITKEVEFEEKNANSVAWNTEFEEMFCYSGNGELCIKTADFPLHRQKLQGFVVGFKGSKIFCLHYVSMQTIDVPQSASMFRYIERGDFDTAHKVACLGVTQHDWRSLAMAALSGLDLATARKAFIRLRDVRFTELITRIELARKQPGHKDADFIGDILAYQGKYEEAASTWLKIGKRRKAIEMFLDLRDWERAKEIVEQVAAEQNASGSAAEAVGVNMQELLLSQARWLQDMGELKSAAEVFWAAKEHLRAIHILGEQQWLDLLMDKVRTLSKMDTAALEAAGQYFTKHKQHEFAKETFLKLGDVKSLMDLNVKHNRWEDAFELAKTHPEFSADIYLPFAEWLALNDRFDEASNAFKKAGRPDQALSLLHDLSDNARDESRFDDAGYYFWLLAVEHLKFIEADDPHKMTADDKKHMALFGEYNNKAAQYYAYHSIHRFTEEPFTSLLPETIFHTAQFVLNDLSNDDDPPKGISKVFSLYAIAKQGQNLEAFKLARKAYDRLRSLVVPRSWRDPIDLASLTIRSRPFSDKEDLQPVCYKCGTTNPLLNDTGDVCINCKHPFIRGFLSFDTLPLVEFKIDNSVTPQEAAAILSKPARVSNSSSKRPRRRNENIGGDSDDDENVMNLEDDDDDDDEGEEQPQDDEFNRQLMGLEPRMDGSFADITVGRDTLLTLPRKEVFVVRWPSSVLGLRFYRNVMSDLTVVQCRNCQHFFHEEDFEFAVLKSRTCPFCRHPCPI